MPPLSQSANANGLVVFARTYEHNDDDVYLLLHGSVEFVLALLSSIFECPSQSQYANANPPVGFKATLAHIESAAPAPVGQSSAGFNGSPPF